MATKRNLDVAGLLAILIVAGIGVGMIILRAPGVTKANFDRVENGMTIAEVDAILGTHLVLIDEPAGKMMHYEGPEFGDGPARVIFNEDGLVREKMWSGPFRDTFIQRLKNWIKGPSPD